MSDPVWIDQSIVLAIHEHQIREHGGTSGLRDCGLLESALARPQHIFAYSDPSLYSLAAAYSHSIIKNHPFVDGNKRTGFVIGILFLELNGLSFTAVEIDATQKVLDLAAGTIGEGDYMRWLEHNCE